MGRKYDYAFFFEFNEVQHQKAVKHNIIAPLVVIPTLKSVHIFVLKLHWLLVVDHSFGPVRFWGVDLIQFSLF